MNQQPEFGSLATVQCDVPPTGPIGVVLKAEQGGLVSVQCVSGCRSNIVKYSPGSFMYEELFTQKGFIPGESYRFCLYRLEDAVGTYMFNMVRGDIGTLLRDTALMRKMPEVGKVICLRTDFV